jgi:hypothetical protein
MVDLLAASPAARTRSAYAIPRWVMGLLVFDLALGVVYVAHFLAGRPSQFLTHLIDLDGEANFPTWWASMQWFLAAVGATIAILPRLDRHRIRTWFLGVLPLFLLAFSVDEVAMIHETLGQRSDVLLPAGSRAATTGLFHTTGLWMVMLGIPTAIALIVTLAAIVPLIRAPRAWRLLGVGLAVFMTGAVGAEVFSNFTTAGTFGEVVQVTIEEMLEFVGSTLVLWGAWRLARASGFRLDLATFAATEDDR